ncbi:hypothetical protein [Actinoplanes sp. NPDC049316]|uniref:hypothetical protein n=1 Tax=Actinoplanes sp. NPDC049316 TaxID=3154727 RepID=UPI00344AC045
MAAGRQDRERRSFRRWFHDTFDDLGFRALIGPAQTRGAIQGCDQPAREQWKHDLENRRRYSREQRERRRTGHQEQQSR